MSKERAEFLKRSWTSQAAADAHSHDHCSNRRGEQVALLSRLIRHAGSSRLGRHGKSGKQVACAAEADGSSP